MPALGSSIERYNASLPSLVPIPESFGPKSIPRLLIWWQVEQALAERKNTFSPFLIFPFIWISLAKGGNCFPSPCGAGKS